ncbi:alpha-1,2-fucosyltransferase [Streptococcus saliviloxodontae]|uniref:Alpha-1,2-fucosyltransferase n=1 Tax=Streptococcus saliviloxodontae TaxID=1349416 RepID=A0ABS2PKL3_9STRE|nr:alpha-1,2-fucosyltransferase [Streptococcus saliviloxodontae]MBM7635973.1 hypothetical protein [Streptococcus saliviloxodontae]
MIFLEMYGRTGNQLFRYAMARSLQLSHYPEEELVISFDQIDQMALEDPTYYNALEDYHVAPYTVYPKKGKVLFNESSLLQKLVLIPYYAGLRRFTPKQMTEQYRYQKKWEKYLNNQGLYWFRTGFIKPKYSKAKHKFVSGNLEAKAYFDEHRDILLKELQPKYAPLPSNDDLYKRIASTTSVCLSVRRGDFERDTTIKNLHSICDKSYFERAIAKMKEINPDVTFFMFSDDIEWVKENIVTDAPTYYESGDDPVWEKLRLMSSCQHFILSNSSFSWWSQYLSTAKDKLVISPSKWFRNDYSADLIEKDWILIDID